MHPCNATVLFRALPAPFKLSAEEKDAIRTFARSLATRVANCRPFLCVITDDRELRGLNNRFLGHDYPTDVLSFPSDHSFPSDGVVGELGEMTISVERAEAQALEFGHSRVDEICILMLHGLLHLCGLDHERDNSRMGVAEQRWREELNLPLNLIARATPSRLVR